MATRSVISVMVGVTAHSNGIPSQGYFFLNKLIKVFETHKSTDVSQSKGTKKKRGKERNAMLKPAEQ